LVYRRHVGSERRTKTRQFYGPLRRRSNFQPWRYCCCRYWEQPSPGALLSAQGQYKRSLRLKELGGQGQTWHGHLRYPMGVAVDGSSTVAFVADTHHHRVVAMRLTDGQQVGRAVEGVGDFLSGGTKLYYPRGVTWAVIQSPMITHVASKIRVLLIADSGNHRVLCLQAYVPVQMHARTHARMHARTHARTHARS
jgi:hypothetical protein